MNRHTKRTGLLLAGLMAGSLLVGCSAGTPANTTSAATSAVTTAAPATTQPGTQTTELELTLEELAKYDGKNGQPAYVAVDGIIYDVTNSPAWKGGGHNGFMAGKDLTQEIKNVSPHGVSKLGNVPAVGKLKK